jgi:hypothetical protein
MAIDISNIRTSRLGHSSKSLFFKTRRGATWLIAAVRQCLNSYSIEFKVTATTIVLRLSQTHSRMAYYQCFGIHFRKLSMRNVYGIKLSNVLYATRAFGKVDTTPNAAMLANWEEAPSVDTIREELMERIRTYLEDKEQNGDTEDETIPGRVEVPNDADTNRFELSAEASLPHEMMGSITLPAELEDRPAGLFRRKKAFQHPENLVELPA